MDITKTVNLTHTYASSLSSWIPVQRLFNYLCFVFVCFSTGDLVYNVTDGLGWCYAAFCNASCEIETQSSPCPVTPSVPTTAHSTTTVFSTTTKATISSSVPLTTTSPASFTSSTSITSSTQNVCNEVYPPRQVWHDYICFYYLLSEGNVWAFC